MTAYHDLDSPAEMRLDAAAAEQRLPRVDDRLVSADWFASYPQDLPKREIEITEAAQRLANALSLHLD